MDEITTMPAFDVMNNAAVCKFIASLPPRDMFLLTQDNRKNFQIIYGDPGCRKKFEHMTDVREVCSYSSLFVVYTAAGKGTSYEMVTDLSLNEFAQSEKEGKHCIRYLKRLLKRLKLITKNKDLLIERKCGLCGNGHSGETNYMVGSQKPCHNHRCITCLSCLRQFGMDDTEFQKNVVSADTL